DPLRPLHSFPTRRSSDLVVSPYRMALWKDNSRQLLLPGPSSGRRSFFPQSSGQVFGTADIVQCTTLAGVCELCGGAQDLSGRLRSEEHTSELKSLAYLVC